MCLRLSTCCFCHDLEDGSFWAAVAQLILSAVTLAFSLASLDAPCALISLSALALSVQLIFAVRRRLNPALKLWLILKGLLTCVVVGCFAWTIGYAFYTGEVRKWRTEEVPIGHFLFGFDGGELIKLFITTAT